MQCEKFIKNNLNGIRTEITDSTAKAAEILSRETKKAASIGNRRTAELYRLKIINPDIGNDYNVTRFIHISRETAGKHKGDKSSIIFTLPDKPGALYEVLGIFANRNLNLCKIESRPSRDRKASFSFYIEIDIGSCNLEEVLEELESYCNYIRYLGSYQRRET